jgi:hypothetical protein
VLLLPFINVERSEAVPPHATLQHFRCMGNAHTRSTDSELAESVRFSERGEEALSELPEALGSLSEQPPALFSNGHQASTK